MAHDPKNSDLHVTNVTKKKYNWTFGYTKIHAIHQQVTDHKCLKCAAPKIVYLHTLSSRQIARWPEPAGRQILPAQKILK